MVFPESLTDTDLQPFKIRRLDLILKKVRTPTRTSSLTPSHSLSSTATESMIRKQELKIYCTCPSIP